MSAKTTALSSSLKSALAQNNLTIEQLAKMTEIDAKKLNLVGPRVYAEARRLTSKKGGARAGAGRKTRDGATDLVQVAVWVTRPQREKLKDLGGSVWMRGAISAADQSPRVELAG